MAKILGAKIHNAALLIGLSACAALAGFTTPNCPAVQDSEFRYTKLVTKTLDTSLTEPIKVALDLKADNAVDIYFTERHGKVKLYDGAKHTVSVVGFLNVYSDSPDKAAITGEAETGLTGIALDPDFKNNHYMYLYYAPWEDTVFRIARFTVNNGKMDSSSIKILLDIPIGREHGARSPIVLPGGVLTFDAYGDLWIAVGANADLGPSVNEKYRDLSAEASSSNLADLRGSILRIHPDNSPKGYTVPKGNFAEYWTAQYTSQGKTALATEYADPKKVLPEIYIKGVRNPYSLSVDPVRRWVVWGDFGPNRFGASRVEEDDLATHPTFEGYPYWSGKNFFVLDGLEPWTSAHMDPAAPVNNSVWNSGPKQLPPADTALYAYSAGLNNGFIVGNHPTSGPIYNYDPNSPSPIKFPPHFDKAWFVTDRMNGVRVFQVDETGTRIIDSMAVLTNQKLEKPLDLKQGPDGALYVVDYGPGWHATSPTTHIGRIEYTGACRPGVVVGAIFSGPLAGPVPRIRLTAQTIYVDEPGPHVLRIRDMRGAEVRALHGDGPMSHKLGLPARKGVYLVTVELPRASHTFMIPEL